MKKQRLIYGFLLFLALFMAACQSKERQISRFVGQLEEQVEKAEASTDALARVIDLSLDSIQAVATADPTILYYVFDDRQMRYWSNNWLASTHVYLSRYDQWAYRRFDNAHTICRWQRAGSYNILTVIPICYAYAFENDQLRNTFCPPFSLGRDMAVSRDVRDDGVPVTLPDGTYLFSIYERDTTEQVQPEGSLADSFSYPSLLTTGAPSLRKVHRSFFTFLVLTIVLFLFFIGWGIVGVLRAGGVRHMRITQKFQYILVTTLLVTFAYIFAVTMRFARVRYATRQETMLADKARYIQKSLQDIYLWNISLTAANTETLNVFLRDLCFVYETDINVYDLSGQLVGSSSPAIFDNAILSTRMAPKPFFADSARMVVEEQIGGMRYRAAYTEFVNANYMPIGYIAVPYYLSRDEVHRDVDDFLSYVFPAYFVILLCCLIFGLVFSRKMTEPLTRLADSMQQFRVGRHNERLHYTRHDEVGALVERYNRLVEQLETSTEQLARSEREGAWRTMARQIAHEINNPLTPMKLTIQQLQRLKETGDERFDLYFRRSSRTLIEEIDNLSNIASSFSAFAKMPEVQRQQVDVAGRLLSAISLFRNNVENIPVRYVGVEQGVYAMTDEKLISEVFTNLLKNALQALEARPDGEQLRAPDIIVILKEHADSVEISFSDNGPGIPEEVQDKVFAPNFTTKSTGTGLGLAISKNIVEASGGSIRFEASDLGTTFFVTLPKQ